MMEEVAALDISALKDFQYYNLQCKCDVEKRIIVA